MVVEPLRLVSRVFCAILFASVAARAQSISNPLSFVPVAPCRIADTRNANGPFGGPELMAGSSRDFDIPQSGCGIPSTAAAYSLNVTVVPDAQLGYLTIWPTGQAQPFVSTLNSDGRIKANAAIVPAGANGAVSVYVTNGTQLVLDIDGYFVPTGSSSSELAFYPLTPCRVADTRQATAPLEGPYLSGGTAGRQFPVLSSACNIPGNAQAYSLNITAVPHGALGFITVWPTGQSQPLVSTLNALNGTVVANAAIVPAGSNGDVSVFASNDTDLVVDVDGYFAPAASGGLLLYTLSPCRVLDTRLSSGLFSGTLGVNVAGSSCSVPMTAQAHVLNATVVPAGPLGYLTLWPAGQSQPLVSTLNALDGAVASNMALVPTSNGSINAFASNATELILDISGFFASTSSPCTGCGTITVSNDTIGQSLEDSITVTLNPAAGSSGLNITYASSNPSVLLVGSSSNIAGMGSVTTNIPAGTQSFTIEAQALAGSLQAGTATITVAASGYNTGTGTVTFGNSGFVLAGPNGIGTDFSAFEGSATTLTLESALLNSTGTIAANQPVAGGLSFAVPVNSGNTTAGTVSPASVTFTGGQTSETTTFNPGMTTGTTNLSLTSPSGFTLPSSGASLNATVQQAGIIPFTATVANGLETTANISLSGPADGNVPITITSDSANVLFACNPGESSTQCTTPGSVAAQTITVTVTSGFSISPIFIVEGFANSDTVGYTASAPGLTTVTGSITLAPAALGIRPPGGGIGQSSFSALSQAGTATLAIWTGYFSGGNFVAENLINGPLTVTLTSSNPGVANVASPITITAGNDSANSGLTPVSQNTTGSTTVSVTAPGFTSATIGATFTTQQPLLLLSGDSNLANGLELPYTVSILAQPTPVAVTVMSTSGSLLFSNTAAGMGSSSLVVTIPANTASATFYVQAGANSGSGTITASATGFTNGTASLNLHPAGVTIIPGVFGSSSTLGSAQLSFAWLDSTGTPNFDGFLVANNAISIGASSSNTSVASVTSTVTVTPGNPAPAIPVTFGSDGSATISIIQPSGFGTPNKLTSSSVTVSN